MAELPVDKFTFVITRYDVVCARQPVTKQLMQGEMLICTLRPYLWSGIDLKRNCYITT